MNARVEAAPPPHETITNLVSLSSSSSLLLRDSRSPIETFIVNRVAKKGGRGNMVSRRKQIPRVSHRTLIETGPAEEKEDLGR